MRCHDPVGLKFLCTVDDDVAAYQWTKNLAYGACITQDYFQPNRVTVQPGSNCVTVQPGSNRVTVQPGSNRVTVHPRGQTVDC